MNKPQRIHYIDWLRVMAVFSVILFHVMRFFDPAPWLVKNNINTEAFVIPIVFFGHWVMPLFFVLSGASIYFSFRSRRPREFIKARVLRLLIPFLFIGLLVLVPPQEYVRLVTNGIIQPEMTFLEFYPLFFLANADNIIISEFPWFGIPMRTLWYLLWLFIFSVVLLPLFMYLRKDSGRFMISKMASIFTRRYMIFLLALPLALSSSLLDAVIPVYNIDLHNSYGGRNPLAYSTLLVLGYLLFADKRFGDAIERHRRSSLILAVVSFITFITVLMLYWETSAVSFGSYGYLIVSFFRGFNSWFWIIAILGYGKRFLNFKSPRMRHFSEGALPYYMLSNTVIVIIGFFIASWQMNIILKFIILLASSFIATFVIYEFAVRRLNATRILFGLKPKDRLEKL